MHPSYPTRALSRRWRVGYRRKGRRLAGVFVAVLAGWVLAAWWAIGWVVTDVLPHRSWMGL